MYSKLKCLRKEYNYTSAYMSSLLNITQAYYSQLETGKRNLSYDRALQIAKIFNMKPDEIFYEDHIKNRLK